MLSYLWGSSKKEETKVEENADPELALRETLDAHGDFSFNMDGTMSFDHYLIFRSICLRQACRHFSETKEKLEE